MNGQARNYTIVRSGPDEKPSRVTVDGKVYLIEQNGEGYRWYLVKRDPLTGGERSEVVNRPSADAMERGLAALGRQD